MTKLLKADLNILEIISDCKEPAKMRFIINCTKYSIDEIKVSLGKLKEHGKIEVAEGSELMYQIKK